jgi:ssDNA thymidine ADP-ribosyltransferase, DarT
MVSSSGSPALANSDEGVLAVITERNITRVVHFTPLVNLPSIAQLGLVPRGQLELLGIPFAKPDQQRLDGLLNHSCLSVGWHNSFMFHVKTGGNARGWALIEFSPSVLATRGCTFFPFNAASSEARAMYRESPAALSGGAALEAMYAACIKEHPRSVLIAPEMPTHPQAEVLCSRVLSWDSVERVILFCEEDRQELERAAWRIFERTVIVDPARFANRSDWSEWVGR